MSRKIFADDYRNVGKLWEELVDIEAKHGVHQEVLLWVIDGLRKNPERELMTILAEAKTEWDV